MWTSPSLTYGVKGLHSLHTPVGDIIGRHKLRFKIYADDTQLTISFNVKDSNDLTVSIDLIRECVAKNNMITTNMLKLNANKTEVCS